MPVPTRRPNGPGAHRARPALPLDLGECGPEAGEVRQRHLFAVRYHATSRDQACEIAVQAANTVLGEPMQRGRRENGVYRRLRQCIAPPWVAQVGAHDLHAIVVGERGCRDGEHHRIDVDSDRPCPGQPIE
jgi:hypothetical protein